MKIKINTVIFIISIAFFAPKTIAQEHKNAWFRTTISIPVSEKIKTDFELQHRRQNDFNSNNFFDKNLTYSFRTWIYYKQNKNVVFALSPFAYFSNYKIIQNPMEAFLKPTNEYRFAASVEFQSELAKRFFIVDRTATEYRAFEGSIKNTIRFRNRLAFRYEFTSKFNTTIGDELLLNTSGTDSQNGFDHNRLFANLSFQPKTTFKFDLGYIYISRATNNNTNLLEESNMYLNFTYILKQKKLHKS